MYYIPITFFFFFFFFLRSTQGGENTIYGQTETAYQVSSVGLHVEKKTDTTAD